MMVTAQIPAGYLAKIKGKEDVQNGLLVVAQPPFRSFGKILKVPELSFLFCTAGQEGAKKCCNDSLFYEGMSNIQLLLDLQEADQDCR